jgi:hypothetical protein
MARTYYTYTGLVIVIIVEYRVEQFKKLAAPSPGGIKS